MIFEGEDYDLKAVAASSLIFLGRTLYDLVAGRKKDSLSLCGINPIWIA